MSDGRKRRPLRSFPRTVKNADHRLKELVARALEVGVSPTELETAIRGERRRSGRALDRTR